jgi:RNA polymerase sigma factor (sigma-70 family)
MEGETEAAWALFSERYRPLILATIRRAVHEHDSVLDVFAHVCQALAADDLARLKRFNEKAAPAARFSTWLVTVVHHQTIDWLRQQDGRRRLSVPAELSPLQQKIFQHVFGDRRSHAEAYELLCAGGHCALPYGAFLREVAETYRVVERTRGKRGVMRYLVPAQPLTAESAANPHDQFSAFQLAEEMTAALDTLPADERFALQLFVVDGVSAAEVARLVGWPNAKAVYNRTYRTLAALRARLVRQGIGPGDL